ncbi:MAG: hypothetical protein ACYTGL_11185 [Planctomycetota bacterium]|jgi:hypothetical protein
MSDVTVTRRDFALGLAVLPALITAAAAQNERKPAPAPTPVPEDSTQTKAEEAEPESREVPEAAWLLGLILKRYPDERLDETAVRGILRDIQSDIRRSKPLSDFPLDNSDEPAFVFRPYAGD